MRIGARPLRWNPRLCLAPTPLLRPRWIKKIWRDGGLGNGSLFLSLSLPPSFSFSISVSILSILSICLSIYICIYIYIYIYIYPSLSLSLSVPKEKKSSRWKWPFLNMWRRYQELNAYLSRVTGVSISQDDFACSATDGNGNFFREAAWEYARSSSSAQILNWVFSCNSNFNFTATVTWTYHTNTRLPPPQVDFVQQPHNGHWLCTNRRNRVHSGKSLVYMITLISQCAKWTRSTLFDPNCKYNIYSQLSPDNIYHADIDEATLTSERSLEQSRPVCFLIRPCH